MTTVGIIDYGLGNLASVAGAMDKLGAEAVVSGDPAALAACDKLILPGVGAFGDGMRNLHERGLVAPLTRMVMEDKTPLLGICLGFQLLARTSAEFGPTEGLGWIDAEVVRLQPADGLRVPHVGWNELHQRRPDAPLFKDIPDAALFYYVHSYHLVVGDAAIVTGTCPYGLDVTAAYQVGNIHGVQFHPEKSQQHGLQMLRNFVEAG